MLSASAANSDADITSIARFEARQPFFNEAHEVLSHVNDVVMFFEKLNNRVIKPGECAQSRFPMRVGK